MKTNRQNQRQKRAFIIGLLGFLWLFPAVPAQESNEAIVKSEFISDNPPTPSSHASTIAETRSGLAAAWFGGTREGNMDVSIWISRHNGQQWSPAAELINGADEAEHVRYPCWNPVLFRSRYGPLYLFYKVGRSPSTWWGMVMSSENEGQTWTRPKRLPKDIYGPIRNKPIELPDGTILCGSSTENAGWRVHIERTRYPFGEWTKTGPLNSAMEYGAIQPTFLLHDPERLQILCRTKSGVVTECWSEDKGFTWHRMTSTGLPNPNSAIDALMLHDGRSLLVFNPTTSGRGVLSLAMSKDGRFWNSAVELENSPGEEFSYPAIVQSSDGRLHITYTWKRQKIKHVVIDPFRLKAGPLLNPPPAE